MLDFWGAFCAARKGKRDRVAVATFEFDLERDFLALEAQPKMNWPRPVW